MIPDAGRSPIETVEWCRYRLPYVRAFTTAHGAEQVREGLLLRVTDREGRVGVGEAAPVPSFGGGTLDDALAQAGPVLSRLRGQQPGDALTLALRLTVDRPGGGPASALVETALLDLLGHQLHRPLAASMTDAPAESVPVNATVGVADPDAAAAAAQRAVAEGFGCVKLKVGVAADDAAELDRIAAVRAAIGPAARLRLDANGAWDADRAISLLGAAARCDLELVEQPVPAADLAGLRRVREALDVPIAADEAASTLAQSNRVLRAEAADVLIVKPALAGGPRRARQIVERAQERGVDVVVTSVVDSGVGVAAALHLAATLPPDRAPGPLAHGLATGPLLVADLLRHSFRIRSGRMDLRVGAGLGVDLDEAQVERYATPWQPVTAGAPEPAARRRSR